MSPIEQMKADVGALLGGAEPKEEVQENVGTTDATNDIPGVANSDDGHVNNDANLQIEEEPQGEEEGQAQELSERDQIELEKALSSGWKEPDNFKGHPDDFIKPREWNRTVALYRRIDREAAERKRLQEQVESFGDRVKNVMELAKANAISELESKKREAVEVADYDEVTRIDKQINQTNDDYAVEEPEVAPQTLRTEVEDWMQENPWFEKDQDMTEFALSFQHAQLSRLKDPSNPTSEELSKALSNTTRALRNEYPDKFSVRKQPRHKAPIVERGTLKSSPKKFTYNDLTSEEKKVLSNIERLPGGMSRDAYVQAIADMRGSK